MIKCPVNRGRFSKCPEGVALGILLNLPRFKGHLITYIPQSMRLLCNNMIAEGINNALTHLFSEISLLNWFSDAFTYNK